MIQVPACLLYTDTPILLELSFPPYAGKGSRESKDCPVNLFPRLRESGPTSLVSERKRDTVVRTRQPKAKGPWEVESSPSGVGWGLQVEIQNGPDRGK